MKNVFCGMTADRLMTYLDDPAGHPAVAAHVATCPECRRKLAQAARAVNAPKMKHLSCEQCEASLPEYVQAQIEGRIPAALMPNVAMHLAGCANCGRLYHEMASIDHAVETAALVQPPAHPRPDLSFLTKPDVEAGPTVWKQLQVKVRRVAERVEIEVQGLAAGWAWLAQSVRPQPVAALAVRGEEGKLEAGSYEIDLGPDQLDNLDVKVIVRRHPDRADVAKVVIQVKVLGRLAAGFAGSRVEMKTGQITREELTSDDGVADFGEVPLAELQQTTFTVFPP